MDVAVVEAVNRVERALADTRSKVSEELRGLPRD
jgi:hypothetical protein